jgi:signal transduction histidine kinase
LFRNGFRVMPYGQKDDDWLGLDASHGRRSILPPHASKNFIGYVEIRDTHGVHFEETLSREGLIENDAFEELKKFCYEVLVQTALRIGSIRGRKQKTSDRPKTPETLRELAAQLSVSLAEDLTEPIRQDSVVALLRRSAEEVDDFIQEISMLRVLASLGVVIGQFTHEVRHDIAALGADVGNMRPVVAREPVAIAILDRLSSNLRSLRTFAAYFDHMVAANARRELARQDLREVVGRFHRAMADRLASQKIEFVSEFRGSDLLTRPMHPSEWGSILLNLFTNAERAIRRANALPAKMSVKVFRRDSSLVVEFSDNGDGIPLQNRERVFDPFFTTTPQSDDQDSPAQGTGLGLKIVRDIVSSAGGTIQVGDPVPGFVTTFRIELPSEQ